MVIDLQDLALKDAIGRFKNRIQAVRIHFVRSEQAEVARFAI